MRGIRLYGLIAVLDLATAAAAALLLGSVLASVACVALAQAAGASSWVETEQSRVRLISARDAVGPDGALLLGLQVDLAPGWKIYWRDPGDAGLPPRFDWSASDNLAAMEVKWPAPHAYEVSGLRTLGYSDRVVYPLVGRARHTDRPVMMRLKVDYGICHDVCIPYVAELALDLPPGAAEPGPLAPLVDQFLRRVPASGDAEIRTRGLDVTAATVSGAGAQQVLSLRLAASPSLRAPEVFVEAAPAGSAPLFYFGRGETTLAADGGEAVVRLAVDAGRRPRPLAGTVVTVTVVDGERAIERRLVVSGP